MNDIIVIKCPWCSTPLKVRNQPGIEGKSITCPVCSNKSPFTSFGRASNPFQSQVPGQSGYPGNAGDGATQYGPAGFGTDDASTNYIPPKPDAQLSSQPVENRNIGLLKVVGTDQVFPLRTGRNVIGRKASSSGADIQIATGESRAVSREHLVIEVKNIPGAGVTHYVSLYKENVNRTFVGAEQLLYGDVVKLKSGDLIKLHETTIKFEIPDPDATTIA